MKTIIFLSFILFSTISYSQTVIKTLQQVTSVDTVQVEVELNITRPNSSINEITIYTAPGNSGTIQFSAGEVINANHYPWPADKSFTVKVKNGTSNLRYKASGAGQKFFVVQ